ncbi:hypothetical protein ACHAXT_002058 [Thalassiosira profunda]
MADPDDAALGLNLVFSPPSAGPSAAALNGGNGGGGGKKPKRKTKYDRRRERGRLAKLAKEQQKRQGQRGEPGNITDGDINEVGGGSGTLAGVAAVLGSGTRKAGRSPAGTSRVANEKRPASEDSSAEKKEASATKDAEGGEGESSPERKLAPALPAEESSEGSGGETPTEDAKRQAAPDSSRNSAPAPSAPAEGATVSSRRHRAPASLSEEQRSKYLSEFHARPRELDRSEKAARDIKPSLASDHIFGRDVNGEDGEGDDDVESEGDESEGGNGEGKVGTNAAATDDAPACPFRRLGLHPHLASTLTSPDKPFKLRQPTIVQSRSIAALLPSTATKQKKRKPTKKAESNLFVQSETGSGKTLAYLLPILQHLAVDPATGSLKRVDRQLGGTRAIILCPTRELATQTYAVANNLCRTFPWIVPGCLSGGEKRKSEKSRLRKGISILIATPGRLLDHLSKTECLLVGLKNKLEWLVLDEADRLLDAGLGGQVEQIVQYLRANQPGSGPRRDGVTWRSVLVSATVTKEIEGLAKTVLGGEGWMWARGHRGAAEKSSGSTDGGEGDEGETEARTEDHELDHAAPRQLAQLYMVVSAKLRLASLVAFLAARAAKGERTVVFLSTCDSVDYHHALFTSMESILGDATNNEASEAGIFGKACPIYKLHGDIPHQKRLATLQSFGANERSSVLLATDVAARGLNFPSLDWIVQYDVPCETKDYVHRAGRSARAGKAGHAVLFLLPSERQYVEVLQLRGLTDISALSLSSTLTAAAGICTGVAQEGQAKAAGNTFSDGRGEAFTLAIQERLEQCVVRDDAEYRAAIEKKFKGDPKQRRKLKKATTGPLLEGARKAFSAYVRAYPAKEKAVRHIFNARALHLGHVARSLALREAPKVVSKGSGGAKKNKNADGGKETSREGGRGEKRTSRLAFGDRAAERSGGEEAAIQDDEQERNLSWLSAMGGGADVGIGNRASDAKRKKSKSAGGAKGAQKRMMEAAMLMQAQEFM